MENADTDVFRAVVNKRLKRSVRMGIERTVALRWEGAAESRSIKSVRMASIGGLHASRAAGIMFALSMVATL